MDLQEYIRIVPDFRKKGISYKDITPLLQSPKAIAYSVEKFIKPLLK